MKKKRKLKTALCISGQMRTYKRCYGNLKKYMLQPLQPDIFIHTWERTGQRVQNKQKKKKSAYKVTDALLNDLYSPVAVVIEPFKKEYFNELKGIRRPEILRKKSPLHSKSNLPLFYKMYACNQLKKNYEAENNFVYDMVIRIRPDLMLMEEIPNIVKNNFDILWVDKYGTVPLYMASDKFAVSNSSNMDYYTSVWEKLPSYWKNPLGNGQWVNYRVEQRLMRYHLNKAKIKTKTFSMYCYILRVGKDKLKINKYRWKLEQALIRLWQRIKLQLKL